VHPLSRQFTRPRSAPSKGEGQGVSSLPFADTAARPPPAFAGAASTGNHPER